MTCGRRAHSRAVLTVCTDRREPCLGILASFGSATSLRRVCLPDAFINPNRERSRSCRELLVLGGIHAEYLDNPGTAVERIRHLPTPRLEASDVPEYSMKQQQSYALVITAFDVRCSAADANPERSQRNLHTAGCSRRMHRTEGSRKEKEMNSLTGKVAIVTGASKGIGAAIAKALATAGAGVAVNYSAGKEGAERTVSEITRSGGKAIAIRADVSKAADVKHLFEETKKAFGAVDVLVNNAGVFQFGPFDAITEAEFHREFDTNVLGTMLVTQEALKYFPRSGGSIINISSIASENPVPNSTLYAATKGAIDTITMALSKELGPRHIRVNTVAPGQTDTEGTRRIGYVGSPEADAGVAATPLGARFGRPDEIAPVVVFLASDDAAWITGERISASGGLH